MLLSISSSCSAWPATGEINWIDEAFPEEIELTSCDDSIEKISMKNMKKVLYLKRSFIEAKLIAMMMTMTFFFDETLILYS